MPIEVNPNICGGKPVIKGTRITVEFILELLANGWSYEEILENYPQLKKEEILEAELFRGCPCMIFRLF